MKRTFFLMTILSSTFISMTNSYALEIPPSSTIENHKVNEQNAQEENNNDNGINVPYEEDDNKNNTSSSTNKLSEDDKHTLRDLDKTLSSNTDYDLLPQNPSPEEKTDYHMKMFVNRVGLMSGITGMCSKKEQELIQECGELILGNWKMVTGETPPEDTLERRQLFRTAWAKREIQALLAVKKMNSPPKCSNIIDDEKSDDMWKICKRKFVDKPLDNPEAQN